MSGPYDVCVIGSGAGGASVACRLAEAGHTVLVLEKGPWFERSEFLKDEIVQSRRPTFKSSVQTEPMVSSWWDIRQGKHLAPTPTAKYWNGNLVGGASELMSGFFIRMKPHDFRVRSTYGPVEGAEPADWPIQYDDLEPYYDLVEKEVGVSGRVVSLPEGLADRRSSPTFPMPPTREHPFSAMIDELAPKQGLHSIPLPRAVLSITDRERFPERSACHYTGYCGSYACYSGAKGAAGAAFLPRALRTGRCDLIARAHVRRLETNDKGAVVRAIYQDRDGKQQSVEARVFVVACQAVESARLLLKSKSRTHPQGLGNNTGQVGRNFISSTFGAGWGEFPLSVHPHLRTPEARGAPFVNRILQDFYRREGMPHNGGTLNFLLLHPNPIAASTMQAFWDQTRVGGHQERLPIWGRALKRKLAHYFTEVEHLKFEVFGEWLPNPDCRVELDPKVKDKYGDPVARVYQRTHPRSIENAWFLVERGMDFLRKMGARNVRSAPTYGTPSTNLLAGTCRFGDDPKTSVLDRNCRAHDTDNLYVTDGSFMPNGGSSPFTFTIYANALRVADQISKRLK